MNITPAILPKSFDEITDKIGRLSGIATRVQIDLCDGRMGRELTWLPEGTEVLPSMDTITYECDLMVNDWRTYVPRVVALGFKRLVIHIDHWNNDDIDEFLAMTTDSHIYTGLAVSNDHLLDEFDDKVRYYREKRHKIFIQVMGIEQIGEQGQSFDESCVERIKHCLQVFPDVHVQVDGAMRPETAQKVADAGAENIVVGSYLSRHDDIGTAFSELSNIDSNICK
jgi:ribulose-phosphate 3-epimerase